MQFLQCVPFLYYFSQGVERHVHDVNRIEYLHVYRVHQEMHTFINRICTIGKLAFSELYLNMMNDQKIVNPKIFTHFKIQAYNEKGV